MKTALQETDSLYKNLFEKNPACMYIFDPATYRILDANQTLLKSYGYTKEEFLNMKLNDFRPHEDFVKTETAVSNQGEQYVSGILNHIKKNGEVITVEINAVKIIYKEKEAVLSIVQDITERVKREEEILKLNASLLVLNEDLRNSVTVANNLNEDLKINEVRLKAAQEEGEKDRQSLLQQANNINIILRSITDIFYIVDKSFAILFANGAVEKLTGLTNEELKGKTIWDVFKDAELTLPKKEFEKALAENQSSEFTMQYREKTFQVYIYPSEIGLAISGKDITEQMSIQTELTQQINNINIILSSITDPFYIIDKNYNFIFLNKAVERFSGFTKTELIGQSVWKIYGNLDFTNARRAFETSFKQNISTEFQCDYKGRTYYAHAYPSEIGLSVSCADITEKKKIDDELTNTLQFIKEVSDNTPGAIYQSVYYPDGTKKITFASEYFEEFTGTPVAEVLKDSEKVFEAAHPEDRERLRNALDESAKSRTKLDIKYRMVNKKTGKVKWVRSNSIPRKMKNGTIIVTGVVMDINESENYYNELEKSNERYEYISKAANEAIWDLDLNTEIMSFGGAYKEMFGYSFPDDKCNYKQLPENVHPEDKLRVQVSMDKVTLAKEPYWEDHYRIIKKTGEIIYVRDRGYITYDEKKGRPVRFVGTTQDITELTKIQEEREKIISDLVKKNRALEQFTYMVSHNLRAPVANIMGLTGIIQEDELDEETKESMIALLIKSSARLDEVIKDMNEILNIQKHFHEDKTEIEFEKILNEVMSIEQRAIEKSNMRIVYDFSKSKSLYTIKSYIQSIFQNLLTNSIKFKKSSGAFLKINSYEDIDFVYLRFEDNGIGFDMKKNNDKIFGLYNRFHLDKEGKGAGLFMVKSQIESLGGEITCESEVNKGTKFIVKFKK